MKTFKNKTADGSVSYEIHIPESDREAFMSDFKNGWPCRAEFRVTETFPEDMVPFVLRTLLEHGLIGKITEEQAINNTLTWGGATSSRVLSIAYYRGKRLVAETRVPFGGPIPDHAAHTGYTGLTEETIYNSKTWDAIEGDKPVNAQRPEFVRNIPTKADREAWVQEQEAEIDAWVKDMDADPNDEEVQQARARIERYREQIAKIE